MFLQLNDDSILNTYWLNNVFTAEEDLTKVVYEMVNGSKRFEQFETEQEASDRVTDVINTLTGGALQK